jgi:aryl-alcohol dehydrogenase-like predicted oxidoreductase
MTFGTTDPSSPFATVSKTPQQEAETLIGRSLHAGASYRYGLAAAEGILRRLRTDYIDLLSIHKFDPFTPAEETARALENLVQRGLVRYVGYSNWTAWQAAKFIGIQKLHDYSSLVAAQMYYALVGRDIEHEVVPSCRDAGIGIVVWSPLTSGFLTGRYTRQDPSGGKGRISGSISCPHDKEKRVRSGREDEGNRRPA